MHNAAMIVLPPQDRTDPGNEVNYVPATFWREVEKFPVPFIYRVLKSIEAAVEEFKQTGQPQVVEIAIGPQQEVNREDRHSQ